MPELGMSIKPDRRGGGTQGGTPLRARCSPLARVRTPPSPQYRSRGKADEYEPQLLFAVRLARMALVAALKPRAPFDVLILYDKDRLGREPVGADDLHRDRPRYALDDGSLFVAYFASAELGCHLALGWPLPAKLLDLYVEFRVLTNGRPLRCGSSLLGALTLRARRDGCGREGRDARPRPPWWSME